MSMSEKEQKIYDIIKQAVEVLNRTKGWTLDLWEVNFGLGTDTELNGLVLLATVVITNTKAKKELRLLFPESYFRPDIPNIKDVDAGITRLKDDDKVIARIAYSIWINRARII